MKTKEVEIKSARLKGGKMREDKKQVVVGKITVTIFETLSEAISKLSEGKVLNLVNTQYETNLKNEFRAAAVGAPSETKLKTEAIMRLTASPEGLAKLAALGGDETKYEALIAEEVAKLKAEKGIATDATLGSEEETDTEENGAEAGEPVAASA